MSNKPENTENNQQKLTDQNLSRRKIMKLGLISAPVLMTMHSRPVLSNTCNFSGMVSGNMSVGGGAAPCNVGAYAFGRSPGYWKQTRKFSVLDRKATTFASIFHPFEDPLFTNYLDLNLFEIFALSESLKNVDSVDDCKAVKGYKGNPKFANLDKYRANFCEYAVGTLNPHLESLALNQTDFELARFATACYLNAVNSGLSSDIPAGYFFQPYQVVDLYLLGAMGGGEYIIAGRTINLTTQDIVDLFVSSFT